MAIVGLNTHSKEQRALSREQIGRRQRQNKSPYREARQTKERYRIDLFDGRIRFGKIAEIQPNEVPEITKSAMENCALCIEGQGRTVDPDECRRTRCAGFYAQV